METTRDIGPHAAELVALAAAATSTYDAFVYDDAKQARQAHELLLQANASEYSPPFVMLVVEEGALAAMASAMPVEAINACRLRAAIALSRAPWLAKGSALRRRLQKAGRTFTPLNPDDYYATRLAVHESTRGKGYGRKLFELLEQEARAAGASRLTLDVSPDHEAAIHLYERLGFKNVGKGEAVDSETGRTLVHLHMAKKL
ncbi:MAG: GNAT family N-acetyltransferase [Phycisphaeraceae bacterium]